MKINIQELKSTIKLTNDSKRSDLLAYVSITFIEEHKRNFTCNGFTIRKSKFDGKPYLTLPSKRNGDDYYKFNIIEKSLFKEIETEILKQYEYITIPVVEV
ncbi:hypothetical protein KJ786_01450 [Patescibacteria group bacterium]|nr:hypothetical protein [Patescibacteria group bacterium]